MSVVHWIYWVSIHSLARGRTAVCTPCKNKMSISIHSLARGRTFWPVRKPKRLLQFQSTPSQEGERNPSIQRTARANISIHSLARGRTSRIFTLKDVSWFQSTPSQEGERTDMVDTLAKDIFQSTPSQEGEPSMRACSTWFLDFNPLPRKRENDNYHNLPQTEKISIHSLVRGRTATPSAIEAIQSISIHSLARGRTAEDTSYFAVKEFQSTPSQEGERRWPQFFQT